MIRISQTVPQQLRAIINGVRLFLLGLSNTVSRNVSVREDSDGRRSAMCIRRVTNRLLIGSRESCFN